VRIGTLSTGVGLWGPLLLTAGRSGFARASSAASDGEIDKQTAIKMVASTWFERLCSWVVSANEKSVREQFLVPAKKSFLSFRTIRDGSAAADAVYCIAHFHKRRKCVTAYKRSQIRQRPPDPPSKIQDDSSYEQVSWPQQAEKPDSTFLKPFVLKEDPDRVASLLLVCTPLRRNVSLPFRVPETAS
jgi:hypothetical protein